MQNFKWLIALHQIPENQVSAVCPLSRSTIYACSQCEEKGTFTGIVEQCATAPFKSSPIDLGAVRIDYRKCQDSECYIEHFFRFGDSCSFLKKAPEALWRMTERKAEFALHVSVDLGICFLLPVQKFIVSTVVFYCLAQISRRARQALK